MPSDFDSQKKADEIDAAYRVSDGCYLLGSLERGVTVYNQQVRAHNLAWALWERRGTNPIGNIAIVGGGIAGLTVAACLLARFDASTKVTLFERLWDLDPLQQGADGRWLHPRIYDWPQYGSRAPGASLPVLNWSEGRASDVARTILRSFGEFCSAFAADPDRLTVFLGSQNFQLDVARKQIDYVATRTTREGAHFHLDRREGRSTTFDCIIIACGFGLETETSPFPFTSYWRNEQLGQPLLDGSQRRYLISGFGDGALVDLCRLTVERFRQDTILYELFGSRLEKLEETLQLELDRLGNSANIYDFLVQSEDQLFSEARREISNRVRKDTSVVLHLRGRDGNIKRISDIFGQNSSILNRLMTFLLFRSGGFSLNFQELEKAVVTTGIPKENVLCRYGANTLGHLRDMIADYDAVEARLLEMKEKREQLPRRIWHPGAFPSPEQQRGLDDG